MVELIILLILLQLKHYVCDFPMQGPYHYLNKGNIRHPGGYVHAGIHAFGTMIVLAFASNLNILWIVSVMAAEFVIHYVVDWSKMNLGAKWKLGPTTCEEFWWLLGLDQYLHQLTYIGIVSLTLLPGGTL